MAFQPWEPDKSPTRGHIGGTILKTGVIELTVNAYRALGEPAAITIDIDPDEYALRLRPASPDTRNAIPIRERHRFAVTRILQHLGIRYQSVSTPCPGERTGITELTLDLSGAPAATTRHKAAG